MRDPTLTALVDAAAPLTEFAWKFHYPGDVGEPTREEAEREIARELVLAVAARLRSA